MLAVVLLGRARGEGASERGVDAEVSCVTKAGGRTLGSRLLSDLVDSIDGREAGKVGGSFCSLRSEVD